MAKIGYARVSTRGQNTDSQLDELAAYGCDKIFTDKVTGKLAARPELDKALAYLREGDVFVITRLSRAMRLLKHLLALADELRSRPACSSRHAARDTRSSTRHSRRHLAVRSAIFMHSACPACSIQQSGHTGGVHGVVLTGTPTRTRPCRPLASRQCGGTGAREIRKQYCDRRARPTAPPSERGTQPHSGRVQPGRDRRPTGHRGQRRPRASSSRPGEGPRPDGGRGRSGSLSCQRPECCGPAQELSIASGPSATALEPRRDESVMGVYVVGLGGDQHAPRG